MMKSNMAMALCPLILCSATAHAVVTFDWATVGNPGNGPDNTGFGAVSYVYRISKHEVTNAQYTEFLNAVDPTGANTRALYNPRMSSDAIGGINFDGSATNGSKYQLKPGRDDNPVVFVSFLDAMRFTNWLQNRQGAGSTESGVYTIGNGANEVRNPNAIYFIPSENEWYKAAHHRNDGVTGNYWNYPTSTDTLPYSDQPPGSGAPIQSNTANFFKNDNIANGYNDGYAVTGSSSLNILQNYLTDVGAYTAALSPYGTFDQGGNAWEWTEAIIGPSLRGVLGGGWSSRVFDLVASSRISAGFSAGEIDLIGFRVARIPEPSTGLIAVLGMLGLLQGRPRTTTTEPGHTAR